MKNIILIGGTGQLGGSFPAEREGYAFISPTRAECDITKPETLERLIATHHAVGVINTSGFHVLPQCEENPEEAFQINCIAVRNMAVVAKKHKAWFVTFSSDYIFDGEGTKPYTETDAPCPIQMYGISKCAGEFAARAVYPDGTYIIRTSGLYGGASGSASRGGNFVTKMLEEAKKNSTIEVSSEQIKSPSYAPHVAEATMKLVFKSMPPGVYHIVNSGLCSWADFTKEIFKVWSLPAMVKPVDRRRDVVAFRRPRYSPLDGSKAERLGVTMPTWQEGLKAYHNYLFNLS